MEYVFISMLLQIYKISLDCASILRQSFLNDSVLENAGKDKGLYNLTALLEFGKGNAEEPTYYESSLGNNKKTEIRTTNYHANKNSTKNVFGSLTEKCYLCTCKMTNFFTDIVKIGKQLHSVFPTKS